MRRVAFITQRSVIDQILTSLASPHRHRGNGLKGTSVSGTFFLGNGFMPISVSYDPATGIVVGSVNGTRTPEIRFGVGGVKYALACKATAASTTFSSWQGWRRSRAACVVTCRKEGRSSDRPSLVQARGWGDRNELLVHMSAAIDDKASLRTRRSSER